MELQASLDEEGGDVSGNLNQLYVYILKEVATAGFKGDLQALENAMFMANVV